MIRQKLQTAELFIFDLDGTLVEFHHEYLFTQAHAILEKLQHPPVAPDALENFFRAFDFFGFVDELGRDAFIETFWNHFDWKNFPAAKPFPGAVETLLRLQNHKTKVALATSRLVPAEVLREEIAHTNLPDCFSLMVTRTEDNIHWSDKRGHLRTVCETLGVDPKLAVMVGDIPPDITSAKEVGIGTTIAVTSGGIREDVLGAANPDVILPNIMEILNLI